MLNQDVEDNNSIGNVEAPVNNAPESTFFQTIINNQNMMSKKLIALEKGMQDMFAQLQNLSSMMSSLSSQSIPSSKPHDSNELVEFAKIGDESALEQFEKKIDDICYRKKLIEHFSSEIGKSINAPMRTVALSVDKKMFTESFWARTAWTGGRKLDGPKKFAFATHTVCISFMNDVMLSVCGSHMSDSAFADFIKSRTRNSGYVRTTDRQPAARTNRTKKMRLIETIDDESVIAENVPPKTAVDTRNNEPSTQQSSSFQTKEKETNQNSNVANTNASI